VGHYGRRAAIESGNAEAKTHRLHLDRGFARVMGTTKNSVLIAFALAGLNHVLLRDWHAKRRRPDPWATHLGEPQPAPTTTKRRSGNTAPSPGIDYPALDTLGAEARRDDPAFAEMCHERAGTTEGGARWRLVAGSGMVIEQAQILTIHNLATLAGPMGARPQAGWADLARRAFRAVCRHTARANPRPLPKIKDAAYAWRQTLFDLSLAAGDEQAATIAWIGEEAARQREPVRSRLAPAVAGST
jgi:hypothetical protein